MTHSQTMDRVADQIGKIILGKDGQIRLALCCLLARGHLLIEDYPGVGKTILAHVLARTLGLEFQRIQFTSDLMPADLLGVSVFDQTVGQFKFHPGPIFSQIILADEVNRATPKAQSALLEAMEERQVTVEGETRPLPSPFFVIATQNPAHHVGAFPLPESQLDRFLMRINLGYPDPAAERELLSGEDRRVLLSRLTPQLDTDSLAPMMAAAAQVHVSPASLDYLQALLLFTRESPIYAIGLSPRAGLALLACARAHAFLDAREYVIPEDVQAVLPAVVGHRLPIHHQQTNDPAQYLLDCVAIP